MTELFPHDEIQKMIDSNPVVVFGKGEKHQPQCRFTSLIQSLFDEVYPKYKMINILDSEELRAEMKIFSDWPTFPQIYINGEFIGGSDIVVEMYENGDIVIE